MVASVACRSARALPLDTLAAKARAKLLKYRHFGRSFKPLVWSAGGLMDRDSYRDIQLRVGPMAAAWMDKRIALALLRFRPRARA